MHVLIVEDDSAPGHFLGQGLRLDGHEVALVADGEEALATAARLRPELMVLDLGLPRKDGMEVLAEMGARFRSTSALIRTVRGEGYVLAAAGKSLAMEASVGPAGEYAERGVASV